MRRYVFIFFLTLFILNIIGLVAIPNSYWHSVEWWQIIAHVTPAITSFCLVLISYWLCQDDVELGDLTIDIHKLKKRLRKIEESTD